MSNAITPSPDEEWAAGLAPDIDRLALCIHRPTGRRPELAEALAPLGLPPQSFIVAAARLLADGRIGREDLRLLGRYQVPHWAEYSLGQHAERGLIVPREDGADYEPTAALRAAAALVLVLEGEEAQRIWQAHEAEVVRAVGLAAEHVAVVADSSEDLPAFRQQVDTHGVLPLHPAAQLLGYVTELRYLRSDVHAAALRSANLEGPAALALHRLWKGFDPGPVPASSLDYLSGMDMVAASEDTWTITQEGEALCQGVEVQTNRRFTTLFGAIPATQRAALATTLAQLPGDDPRTIEDR